MILVALACVVAFVVFCVVTGLWWLLPIAFVLSAWNAYSARKAGLPLWRREPVSAVAATAQDAAAAEPLAALDAFDDLVHNAKTIPMSDQRRIDPDDLREALDRLSGAIRAALPGLGSPQTRFELERLENLVRAAPPVRLTDDVRVDPDEVYEILDRMRELLPQDLWVHHHARGESSGS